MYAECIIWRINVDDMKSERKLLFEAGLSWKGSSFTSVKDVCVFLSFWKQNKYPESTYTYPSYLSHQDNRFTLSHPVSRFILVNFTYAGIDERVRFWRLAVGWSLCCLPWTPSRIVIIHTTILLMNDGHFAHILKLSIDMWVEIS